MVVYTSIGASCLFAHFRSIHAKSFSIANYVYAFPAHRWSSPTASARRDISVRLRRLATGADGVILEIALSFATCRTSLSSSLKLLP